MQYAHARIKSILRRAEGAKEEVSTSVLLEESERVLIKNLADYPAIIKESGEGFNPSTIVNYVYNLVKDYNSFFQSTPILKADSEDSIDLRVALSGKVGEVIASSMLLLGINVPDRM